MENIDDKKKKIISFDKNVAKKIEQELVDDNGPADSQGIEIKSPGKMHWFTIKADSYEDITKVHVTTLFDPDGELEQFIILAEDKSLREENI